ncbi:MAG: DUF2971 domain-containing protein [Erythrobacter sp.]|jgi:hypothetical protein|nr:DUF2971 domain-containing protein [Erythrobacter sp.]
MTVDLPTSDAATRLFTILSPELLDRQAKLRSGEVFLAHYTSAENALNIINGQQFWLRNVRCMNDYSEVRHGIELLLRVFHADDDLRRNRLYSLFDKVVEGAAKQAVDTFDTWLPSLPHGAYIGCLSEFDPDDDQGRLSMWRAYGKHGSSVALVMNSEPFVAETDVLKAYSLPVLYLTDAEFTDRIDKALERIEKEIESFRGLDSAAIQHIIFYWLLFLSLGLKHRGFREEVEWRIVYFPDLERSPTIAEEVETIGGIPQIVQKIPLEDSPERGLHGASVSKLVERVLIGPTEYPLVLFDAFEKALRDRGAANAAEHIKLSDIPLR